MIHIAAHSLDKAKECARLKGIPDGEWKWNEMGSKFTGASSDFISCDELHTSDDTPDFIAALMMAMRHGGKK